MYEAEIAREVDGFSGECTRQTAEWSDRFEKLHKNGKRVGLD